jgi:hypothetical protein
MKRVFVSLVSLTLIFSACKDSGNGKKELVAGEKTEQPGDEKTVKGEEKTENDKNDESAYTINAPEGWEKRDTFYMGQKVVFMKSPLEGATDDFMENMNVITEEVGSMEIKEYLEKNLTNMEAGLTGFERIKLYSRDINGREFWVLRYNHNYGGVPIDAKVFFAIKDGTAYVITCSAKGGKMDQWESRFDEVMNSFRLN